MVAPPILRPSLNLKNPVGLTIPYIPKDFSRILQSICVLIVDDFKVSVVEKRLERFSSSTRSIPGISIGPMFSWFRIRRKVESQNESVTYDAGHHKRSPEGIRTLVAGLRSQSPRPLDDGALVGKAIQFFRWGTRTRT